MWPNFAAKSLEKAGQGGNVVAGPVCTAFLRLAPSTVFMSATIAREKARRRSIIQLRSMAFRSAIAKGGPRALGASLRGMGQARSISTVKLELPELPYSYR